MKEIIKLQKFKIIRQKKLRRMEMMTILTRTEESLLNKQVSNAYLNR